ncbi:MAG: RDD family protein [Oligoflexia bacterium]|nr:RDD family protein [Oligoflexia bacterium]
MVITNQKEKEKKNEDEDQDFIDDSKIVVQYSNIVKRLIAQTIDIAIYIGSIIILTQITQTILKIKLIPKISAISLSKLLSLSVVNNKEINFNITNLIDLFSTEQLIFYLITIIFVWIFITILPEYLTNQSIGKMFVQIRIIDMTNANISLIKSMFRGSIGKLISIISIVGVILPAIRKRGEALHDIISKTYVVDMLE